jgi:8-oxo-dGTP diphosphatase
VVSVVTCKEGIVTILPPDLPPATPAALPAGLIEYGESPEEAAIRETREETGLVTEIVQCLGWLFVRYFAGWPGPMIQFMYEARLIGGELRGSEEGEARIFPIEVFPDIICPERSGSWGAITAYLAGKKSLT